MSIITRFLAVVTEPQFKLARDMTAMAIADGKITEEEREAITQICHLESIDERRLLENLRDDRQYVSAEIPDSKMGKNAYLQELIRLIGADEYCAPQEVYLFQIIASKMGLNQMDVVSLFLLTANRQYFRGDVGTKVLASFLKNHINPVGKSERDNRDNIRALYETIAANTEVLSDIEADGELLRQNLERATETFINNHILVNSFRNAGIDLPMMLREEEMKVLRKYIG